MSTPTPAPIVTGTEAAVIAAIALAVFVVARMAERALSRRSAKPSKE